MVAIKKTFCNYFLLHPCEERAKKKCFGYVIASIAIGILSLGLAHLIVYLKGRVSKKAPELPEVGRAAQLGNQLLRPELPLPVRAPKVINLPRPNAILPLPVMDEYAPPPKYMEYVELDWSEMPVNPGKPLPRLIFSDKVRIMPPAKQMKFFLDAFKEKMEQFFAHFEKSRAIIAKLRQQLPPITEEIINETKSEFRYFHMLNLSIQAHTDGQAVYQVANSNPTIDFSVELQEVLQMWAKVKNQTACLKEAINWLDAMGYTGLER